jgi:voltage-gated potassium channel
MIPAPRRRRRSAPSTASRRPWRTPVLALSLLINLTAVGYRLTEGWDWGDCYWMVVVTLSTMGWSDGTTQPLSTAGRVVTTLAIVGGLVVVQVTIQSLLGLSESGYFRRLRERRFKNWLSMMENHVILCGYGRIGREIADQLVSEGVPLVVVEMDTAQKESAEERGLPVLQADATLDETLVEAGIHQCRSLVAALPNNAANLYVVLSARGIAPRCRLIARSDSEEAARKLRLAGADQVVSPYVAGGRTMAATALRPLAVGFMELLAGSDCEVEEFQLTDDPQRMVSINGRSLAELQLGRQTGVLVLAIRQPAPAEPVISYYRGVAYREDQPRLIANPGSDLRLAPGQLLVVLGSKEQLARFGKLLGPALVSMDAMER